MPEGPEGWKAEASSSAVEDGYTAQLPVQGWSGSHEMMSQNSNIFPSLPQHSSTPDQSNVYFKYTTWTRPVALLGREGHLPAVSGTRRLLSRKHQQLPAYLVSESPGSQKRQEPRRLRAWRRSADRERLSWRVVERTFSAACAASLSAACSSSRSFRPSWTECRVLRGP